MPSDSKMPDSSKIRVGQRLKESREKKSLTIEQVQKQTRIHSSVLRALEEGRCDQILSPTYVRSFLKGYASYLGLDARQILNEYNPKQQASVPSPVSRESVPASFNPGRGLIFIRNIIIVVIALSVLVFISGRVSGCLKRAKGTRISSEQKRRISKNSAAVSIPKSKPLKLKISVHRRVLVKLKIDGNLIFERVLSAGSQETVTAKDRINIYVAKGQSIGLNLNGKDLGSPGTGLIRDVEITRTGIRIK